MKVVCTTQEPCEPLFDHIRCRKAARIWPAVTHVAPACLRESVFPTEMHDYPREHLCVGVSLDDRRARAHLDGCQLALRLREPQGHGAIFFQCIAVAQMPPQ